MPKGSPVPNFPRWAFIVLTLAEWMTDYWLVHWGYYSSYLFDRDALTTIVIVGVLEALR